MIHEIQAKVLLAHVHQPEPWFGLRYNMNIYRGCQHQCIYCDSRSDCYQIENFTDVLVKVNAIDLLRRELPRKRIKGTIGTGSMSDPYLPLEKERCLTGQAMQVIAEHQFPVHIITKSDLVLRDLDVLRRINRIYAAVTFTLTTVDDSLAKKIEPGAPLPSARLRAMQELSKHTILTGVTMMPILPLIEDTEENIAQIVSQAKANGAAYIIPSFGMTLRDRQRLYYYQKLDQHFPGLKQEYIRRFGNQYFAPAQNLPQLEAVFRRLCQQADLLTAIPQFTALKASQLKLPIG
jgi:DNA repair photolyase